MNGRVVGGEKGVKAWARAPLSEDRLMWVLERTPERNSPLFDSQLSDRPSGLAVQPQSPSYSTHVMYTGFNH